MTIMRGNDSLAGTLIHGTDLGDVATLEVGIDSNSLPVGFRLGRHMLEDGPEQPGLTLSGPFA